MGRPDVPYFAGAGKPLLGPHYEPTWPGHGKDGLGGYCLTPGFIPPKVAPQQEHAVQALIRLINANPGEIHLITLGPLTNVALAFSMDPSLPSKLKHLTVLGGTHEHQGNVAQIAEFNMYALSSINAIDVCPTQASRFVFLQ
jgi:purine nucleosidase